MSTIQVDRREHSTTQSSSSKGGPPLFLWDLRCGLRKVTSATLCTSLNGANSHMATDPLTLSTEMKVAKASASVSLSGASRFNTELVADHVVTVTRWCSVSREKHLLIRRVPKLQGLHSSPVFPVSVNRDSNICEDPLMMRASSKTCHHIRLPFSNN